MILLISTFETALDTTTLSFDRKVERRALLDKYKSEGKTDGIVRHKSSTSIEMTFLDRASAEQFAAEALALAQKYGDTVTFEYT